MASVNLRFSVKVCISWVHLKPGVCLAVGDVVTSDMIETRWWIIAWCWIRGLARSAAARLMWWRAR